MNALPPHLKNQAYHEAGHIVFGIRAGKRLQTVAIGIGDDQKAGCATWDLSLPLNGDLTLELLAASKLSGEEAATLFLAHIIENR